MEATGDKNFEDALAQMVAPAETEEKPNQPEAAIEAADDQPTPEVAEESEAEEIADEIDDVELSSDDDDVEIDDNDLEVDLPEEDVRDTLYTVKVDGKDEQWTLEQLKQDASGRAAINKRFQEAAEARKQIEAEANKLKQAQQQVIAMYQQAQQGNIAPPVEPTKELFEKDPIGYMEAKIAYDEQAKAYGQQQQQLQHMHAQQDQQNAYQREAHLAEQAEHLKRHLPELVDPEKGEALRNNLIKTGQYYGWSADEMAGVADHRYVRALNDARKYRELVANKKAKNKPASNNRGPVVKSGAKRREGGNSANAKKLQQKLRKSGSVEDALSLMLKP